MKIYGAILAGGKGLRMGNTELPKQFLKLGNKPVIIHTIEKFKLHEKINQIIVVVPKVWMVYMKDLLKEYNLKNENISVIEGGEDRTESILNTIGYVEKEYGITSEDIIVTHDAVRPFLSYRIIDENIEMTRKYGAVDTVISATDTIVESFDDKFIKQIPNRQYMYQGQTPQSFKIELLKKCYEEMSLQEKLILTDAAKLLILKNHKVALVNGDEFNIKITKQSDLIFANAILSQVAKND